MCACSDCNPESYAARAGLCHAVATSKPATIWQCRLCSPEPGGTEKEAHRGVGQDRVARICLSLLSPTDPLRKPNPAQRCT